MRPEACKDALGATRVRLEELEAANLRYRRQGDFALAYEELAAFIRVATERGHKLDVARAKAILALTYYWDGPRYLPRAMGITQEILEALAPDPVAHAKALINGLTFSALAADVPSMRTLSLRLRAIHTTNPSAVRKWVGRSHLALCRAFSVLQNEELAIRHAEQATVFHRENIGPYNERDRQCYLALSATALGELLVKRDVTCAKEVLEIARAAMPLDSRVEVVDYLEALIAHEMHEDGKVFPLLERALMGATKNKDHGLRFKIGELSARHRLRSGNVDACNRLLDSMIREAAQGRLITTLDRLQRLRAARE